MKKTFILFLLNISTLLCYSQTISENNLTDLSLIDELPTFQDGTSALEKYITKQFELPNLAKEQGTVAKNVSISMVITADGKIKNVKVTKPDPRASSFENELLDVLEKMPDWTPAKKKGVAVNVKYIMDIYVNTGLMEKKPQSVKINDLTKSTKINDAYNSGVKKSQEGNLQGAIDDFSTTLKYNPKDIDALYNRAAMKFKLKDTTGACADWNSIKSFGFTDANELLQKHCGNK